MISRLYIMPWSKNGLRYIMLYCVYYTSIVSGMAMSPSMAIPHTGGLTIIYIYIDIQHIIIHPYTMLCPWHKSRPTELVRTCPFSLLRCHWKIPFRKSKSSSEVCLRSIRIHRVKQSIIPVDSGERDMKIHPTYFSLYTCTNIWDTYTYITKPQKR